MVETFLGIHFFSNLPISHANLQLIKYFKVAITLLLKTTRGFVKDLYTLLYSMRSPINEQQKLLTHMCDYGD